MDKGSRVEQKILSPSLALLSLGTAALAQVLLDARKLPGLSGLLYFTGILLFVYASRGRSTRIQVRQNVPFAEKARPMWLLVAGMLGVAAFWTLAGNRYSLMGTLLWVGGCGALLLGVLGPLRVKWPRFNVRGVMLSWASMALLGITLLGLFLRLYRISEIPREMGCDLPLIYENIRQILDGEFPIFFPAYPGREGLFFYLAAPVCRILGLSHTSIKVASALVGVATIPVIYALGKELFGTKAGLGAAFFLAASPWHLILTRVGFRLCTMPLVLSLFWCAWLRVLKGRRLPDYVLAGFVLGLGFYTYNAFMVAPFLLAGLVLLDWGLTYKQRSRYPWGGLLLLGLATCLILIPLGRYVYEAPESYFYRVATRLTGLEAPLPSNLAMTLLRNTIRALLMFNYRGDGAYIANVPFHRQLGFVAAVLFVLGFGYVVWHWRRKWHGTMLVFFLSMLLPTIFSLAFPNEVPNACRAVGAIVPASLFSGVALSKAAEHLMDWRSSKGRGASRAGLYAGMATWVLVVGALSAEVVGTYRLYFQDYRWHLPGHNYSISLEMARAIRDFEGNGDAFIKIWPYWYDGNAVRAQLHSLGYVWEGELERIDPSVPPLDQVERVLVILHPEDRESLALLEEAFKQHVVLASFGEGGEVTFLRFIGERSPR